MRLCFVGPANSMHIVKWCDWFSNRGHEVHVISFAQGEMKSAQVHWIDIGVNANGNDYEKLKYLTAGKKIKAIIDRIKPDVVNAHYATSYGTAMALSGVKNYVLSVWGSDIYDFPKKSPLHKLLLQYSLKKATRLFSTSQAMADEASKYTDKHFDITPFGVDMELFNPDKRTRKDDVPFTVGTVKTLASLYGIDYIIKAVAIIRNERPELNVAVRISGDGPQAEEYKKLVRDLGIADITTFLGKISQEEAAREWANMDVAVVPSVLYESFGVAAVEAQACGTPVIVSDVNGVLESTIPGKSNEVVQKKNAESIAEAILRLYEDAELRKKMGTEGRKNVGERYELNRCFEGIENLFRTCGGVSSENIIIDVAIEKKKDFIVGTVKGLSDKYGIAYILEAVAAINKQGKIPIKLRIAGRGPQEREYRDLAEKLGINDITEWLGFIPQETAAGEWANMDVAIIPSTLESESFGVAAVEAQACGTAVIISDIPGLMEATRPGISSVVVPRNNAQGIRDAVVELYEHPEMRKKYGNLGVEYVRARYEINNCFEKIQDIFRIVGSQKDINI